MTTPLYLLAYALSRRYYSGEILFILGRVAPYKDPRVASGYKKEFGRLFSIREVTSNVRKEFANFVSGTNVDLDTINDQSRIDAIRWWYLHGQGYMYS